MRLNVAGFVDVGFVRAAVASACGIDTSKVRLDAAQIVSLVEDVAASWSGLFLRAYWFDGQHPVDDARHASQRKYLDAVAATPGIQLRLGHVLTRTPKWHSQLGRALSACGVDRATFERHFVFAPEVQQKGVDTLMVLDLVRLAQRGAYDIAVVFSGDRDIAEAVRAAQDEGRRVVVMVPDDRTVAAELRALADTVVALTPDQLRVLHRSGSASTQVAANPRVDRSARASSTDTLATAPVPDVVTSPVAAASLASRATVAASDPAVTGSRGDDAPAGDEPTDVAAPTPATATATATDDATVTTSWAALVTDHLAASSSTPPAPAPVPALGTTPTIPPAAQEPNPAPETSSAGDETTASEQKHAEPVRQSTPAVPADTASAALPVTRRTDETVPVAGVDDGEKEPAAAAADASAASPGRVAEPEAATSPELAANQPASLPPAAFPFPALPPAFAAAPAAQPTNPAESAAPSDPTPEGEVTGEPGDLGQEGELPTADVADALFGDALFGDALFGDDEPEAGPAPGVDVADALFGDVPDAVATSPAEDLVSSLFDDDPAASAPETAAPGTDVASALFGDD